MGRRKKIDSTSTDNSEIVEGGEPAVSDEATPIEAEEQLTNLGESLGESGASNVLTQILANTILNKDGTPSLSLNAEGIDEAMHESLLSTVETVMPMFMEQAQEYIIGNNLLTEEQYADFYKWVWSDPDAVMPRMQTGEAHYLGDMSKYRDLVSTYHRSRGRS